MTDIEVGQKRRDKKGTVWTVASFRDIAWLKLPNGTGRNFALSTVRKMELVPDVRKIVLPLAFDTTATECNGCSFLGNGDDAYYCSAFDKRAIHRLSECIEAEVK